MKVLKYNLCTMVNHGTEEAPEIEEVLSAVEMPWSEATEEIAKAEAHNGKYTIEEVFTIAGRISELKQNLADTDYNILKIVEGAATLSEMASIIAKRAQWRKEINELEREQEK